MNLLQKAKSITKKLETLSKDRGSLEALFQGVYHYNNKNQTIENLKNYRADICNGCESIKDDDFKKIKDDDNRISGKMCDKCFCSLPYLLRQTKKSCELSKWE